MNLKRTEPSDEALEVDARTRSLYDQYLKHCQSVFQNAAQDTEDIIQVQPPAASLWGSVKERTSDSETNKQIWNIDLFKI